jgi:hypothetical protein
MRRIDFNFRLAPALSGEQEWLYLMDESYAGEQCIVPLLGDLLSAPVDAVGFSRMIRRQITEEEEHVELYARVLGRQPIARSGYDAELMAYVRGLPNTTLKVFCLQVLLEGIGLGALRYRGQALEHNPCEDLDRRLLLDEARHIRFSHVFLKQLIAADGVISTATFNTVASQVNAIFARHFAAESLSELMHRSFAARSCPKRIAESVGMKRFFHVSVNTVVETKLDFTRRYRAAHEAL